MIALGEPIAYAVMGVLSARLPLPTGEYVVAAPQRLPAEDERVDVIFSAVLIVPFLVAPHRVRLARARPHRRRGVVADVAGAARPGAAPDPPAASPRRAPRRARARQATLAQADGD